MKPMSSDEVSRRRQLAETRLQALPNAAGAILSEVELLRLRHELEVHRIELELQNEELRLAQATTEAALRNYTELYDFAPVGYFSLAGDATILAVNLTGAGMVGIERRALLGRRFSILVSAPDRTVFNDYLARVFADGRPESCRLTMDRPEGSPRVVRINGVAAADGGQCRAVILDITESHLAALERERLLGELQESAAQVRVLTGFLPICGHCKKIRDAQGRWEQMEVFITKRSEARFSHGICPECLARHFPQCVQPEPDR